MCCTNRGREGWVTALLLLGVICSLGVAIPMLLITYPGDECLLFTSVRGEALIYGHHAGCIYVTVSHFLMVVASLFFFVMFFWSRAQGSRQDGTASNRSLRGSVAGLSQTIVRTKITLSILVLSIILTIFVFLTAIIILSGYIVTCGELQYETRRQLYGRTTLGSPVKDVYITCWSLFRDADFHNRFHFDHYELAGQWHGQYTTYKHGRPNTWSGKHNHHIPIAVGMELSLACSWFSVVIWVAITSLLSLLRKHVKALNRKEIAESIEDARIWAADMASVGGGGTSLHQYEMVNKNKHYDTIRSVRSQSRISGAPSAITQQTQLPHASTLMEHQEVIAKTHEDGTYFMTSDGNYVQLVNGVLTNVSVTPMMQGAVQYSELAFQPQDSSELNIKLNQIHNQQQQQVVYQQIQHPNQLNPQHLHQQQLQQQQLQQQRLQEQQQQHHQYQLQQQIQIQQQQQQQQQLQHQQLQQQRLKEQQEQQQLQQQEQIHLQQLQMQRQLEEQEALEQQQLLEQQKQKQEEEELKKHHQQRIRQEQMEQEKQLQLKQKQQQQFQRQLNEQLSQRSKQRPRSQLTVPLLSGSPSTTRRSVVSNNQSHVSNHQSHVSNHQSHVSSTSGRKSPGASTNSRRSQISNGQTAVADETPSQSKLVLELHLSKKVEPSLTSGSN